MELHDILDLLADILMPILMFLAYQIKVHLDKTTEELTKLRIEVYQKFVDKNEYETLRQELNDAIWHMEDRIDHTKEAE